MLLTYRKTQSATLCMEKLVYQMIGYVIRQKLSSAYLLTYSLVTEWSDLTWCAGDDVQRLQQQNTTATDEAGCWDWRPHHLWRSYVVDTWIHSTVCLSQQLTDMSLWTVTIRWTLAMNSHPVNTRQHRHRTIIFCKNVVWLYGSTIVKSEQILGVVSLAHFSISGWDTKQGVCFLLAHTVAIITVLLPTPAV